MLTRQEDRVSDTNTENESDDEQVLGELILEEVKTTASSWTMIPEGHMEEINSLACPNNSTELKSSFSSSSIPRLDSKDSVPTYVVENLFDLNTSFESFEPKQIQQPMTLISNNQEDTNNKNEPTQFLWERKLHVPYYLLCTLFIMLSISTGTSIYFYQNYNHYKNLYETCQEQNREYESQIKNNTHKSSTKCNINHQDKHHHNRFNFFHDQNSNNNNNNLLDNCWVNAHAHVGLGSCSSETIDQIKDKSSELIQFTNTWWQQWWDHKLQDPQEETSNGDRTGLLEYDHILLEIKSIQNTLWHSLGNAFDTAKQVIGDATQVTRNLFDDLEQDLNKNNTESLSWPNETTETLKKVGTTVKNKFSSLNEGVTKALKTVANDPTYAILLWLAYDVWLGGGDWED